MFQSVVVDAQALDDAGPESLHDHVGVVGELTEDRVAARVFEIEAHRALVARQRLVDLPRCLIGNVGRWSLDAQHIGAHVGEQQRAVRTRREQAEIQNADPVERSH